MEKNTFIPKNTMNTLNKEIIKPNLNFDSLEIVFNALVVKNGF
jgi:hypothetical protein